MTQVAGIALTVGDLVEAYEPRVAVVAGHDGLATPIENVGVFEVHEPHRWLTPGSFVLSSGSMLRDRSTSEPALIEELAAARMAGLGFGMAPYWVEVPSAMVAAANQRSFPLLTVSGGLRFQEILRYVFGALSSRRTYLLQRSLSIQAALMGLASEGCRLPTFVEYLSEHLGADVLLFDWRGILTCHSRSSRVAEVLADEVGTIWELHLSKPQLDMRALTDCEVHFRKILVAGEMQALLAAVLPLAHGLDSLVDSSLSFTQDLIEADALARLNLPQKVSQARAALLSDVLCQRGGPSDVKERLGRYGIASSDPCRLFLLADGQASGRRQEDSLRPLAEQGASLMSRYLEAAGASFLAAWHEGALAVLLALDVDATESDCRQFAMGMVQHVSSRFGLPHLRCGVSRVFSAGEIDDGLLVQARLALSSGAIGGPSARPVVLHEDLPLPFVALGMLPDEYLEHLTARIVEPLLDADQRTKRQLYPTLVAYLVNDGSLADTARTLYLHRNTLARRLDQIREVAGVDLRTTLGLLEAGMAVEAREVLVARGARGSALGGRHGIGAL